MTDIVVEKDVWIPLADGGRVVADVFRPQGAEGRRHPVLLTMGVYGKDVPFRVFNEAAWKRSELKSGESGADLMVGETPLPDYWVAAGYVVVRFDQPGSGRSPGDLDVFGPAVQAAFHDAVEWAGTQPWSNGKVGILGASYYGVMGWLTAGLRPRHLAAFLPFQGFTDHYRDCIRHGGILTASFVDGWFGREVLPRQFGAPRGTSDEKLDETELATRIAFPKDFREFLRDDALRFATHPYYLERTPDPAAVNVPIFVWANDDGFGLHLRGTIEGYNGATNAPFRALRVYSGSEPDSMYSRRFTEEHRLFFDRFLKGEDNGFEQSPVVQVTVRRAGLPFVERTGTRYPVEGAEPTVFHLGAAGTLSRDAAVKPGELSYASEYKTRGVVGQMVEKVASLFSGENGGEGSVRFATAPLEHDLELLGPMRLRLNVAVDRADADLFVAVREVGPDGTEVTSESGAPISLGWQRISMRHADPARSTALRAWHTYDRELPLKPDLPVAVDVNIWPAAWIVQAGSRLVLEISGEDQKGAGEFLHPPVGPYAPEGGEPLDNGAPPPTRVTIHTGGSDPSSLTASVLTHLPRVPVEAAADGANR